MSQACPMNWIKGGHLQKAQHKILVVIVRYCVTSWSEQFKAHAEEYYQNVSTMYVQNLALNLLESTGNVHTLTWWNTFCTALTKPIWTSTSLDHSQMPEKATNLPVPKKWRYWCVRIFIWLHGCQSKKNYLRVLKSLFIIGQNVLKSSETMWKNDVLTHFVLDALLVLAALLLSNCWFFLTHEHILLISVSLTEQWSWVHSILLSNTGCNSQLLWCSSGISGNCHDGFCPHLILFDIQYSPHY
jgi:hypothetical protein